MAKKKRNGSAKKPSNNAAPGPARLAKQVAIKYSTPEGQTAIFSNLFAVQDDGAEFRLLFFQSQQPLIPPTDSDAVERFNAIDHVKAQCVAQVAISTSRIADVIRVLSENYASHIARQQAQLSETAKQ
jgi:hypothetical protein